MYADIIVDISHEKVDRPFEYIIPEGLEGEIKCGSQVIIPFGKGNRKIKGFVIRIKDKSSYDPSKLKPIISIAPKSKNIDDELIELAAFIKDNYGSTMNRALKTVMPVKEKSNPVVSRFVSSAISREELEKYIDSISGKKKSVSRVRLLKELLNEEILPYQIVRDKLNISPAILKALENEKIIQIDVKENLRNVLNVGDKKEYTIQLNPEQKRISDDIWERYLKHDLKPSLIRGITGSGKTEIYIDLIDKMISQKKQAIVLIPEIALTYQTVLRFYKKFGDRISVINSKLTPAQKHDQLEKARNGAVDIIIGPRSALFVPFKNLGIIIIDEEHESTYKSENVPRYHSREVAIKRAQMSEGIVVMGSATPSIESYYKAEKGDYKLYTLEKRAKGKGLPSVEIIDLKEELASGNRSIISRRLAELISDRLSRGEQVMLFINRRAYKSFVSCRSCGTAIKCPHCDVSLKYHLNGKLICHYCGYEMPMVKTCPNCGSKYIGTFGAGTQKVEEEINKIFPDAKTLRMDMDTTKEKDGHEKILAAFSNHEADILIGTQMIVKGHDFANVTLVGILAADISLYSGGYMSSERTFQLITQASGRAGRGTKKGDVVVQTYSTDNYAITLGAAQDYKAFYNYEMSYRKLLGYPPVMNMLGIVFSSEDRNLLNRKCDIFSALIDREAAHKNIVKIGPSDAPIAKIQDKYRKVIYIKSESYKDLIGIKDLIEDFENKNPDRDFVINFDFSLMGKE